MTEKENPNISDAKKRHQTADISMGNTPLEMTDEEAIAEFDRIVDRVKEYVDNCACDGCRKKRNSENVG